MNDKGLLLRAESLRDRSAVLDGLGKTDDRSGISGDDRREIIAHIEKILHRNRVDLSEDRYIFKPSRRGFVLPLLANILILSSTLVLVYFLSSAFSTREETELREGAALASAEGRLLQELKRDSDTQLQEKDASIIALRKQLENLDLQSSALSVSYDERLKIKETELRASIKQELESERARLSSEGLEASQVQDRLIQLQTDKEIRLQADLALFKRQLEAEKNAADAKLAKLRDDYRNQLVTLNAERNKIQADSRKKEEELRSAAEAKTRALELRTVQESEKLSEARSELARIEEERRVLKINESRITGFYNLISAAFTEHRFADALASSEALRSFLNDPAIVASDKLQSRRNADLFASEYFARNARAEIDKSRSDVDLLLRQAALLESLRTSASKAAAAVAAQETDVALRWYGEVLSIIPESQIAHRFILGRLRDQTETELAALNDEKSALSAERDSLRVEKRAADASLKELRASLALYEQRLADAATEAGRLRNELALKVSAEKNAQISALEADLASANSALQAALQQAERLSAREKEKEATVIPFKPSTSKEAEQIAQIGAAYAKYKNEEDALRSSGIPGAALRSRNAFDAFLNNGQVKSVFPDFGARVNRFEHELSIARSSDSLKNAANIAETALRFKDAASRDRYLASQAARYTSDADMSTFIGSFRNALD
ncbi:hypothetical protein MASR2M78_26070 [Treponema sp.]